MEGRVRAAVHYVVSAGLAGSAGLGAVFQSRVLLTRNDSCCKKVVSGKWQKSCFAYAKRNFSSKRRLSRKLKSLNFSEFVNYRHPGPLRVWKVGSELQFTMSFPLDWLDPLDWVLCPKVVFC